MGEISFNTLEELRDSPKNNFRADLRGLKDLGGLKGVRGATSSVAPNNSTTSQMQKCRSLLEKNLRSA